MDLQMNFTAVQWNVPNSITGVMVTGDYLAPLTVPQDVGLTQLYAYANALLNLEQTTSQEAV